MLANKWRLWMLNSHWTNFLHNIFHLLKINQHIEEIDNIKNVDDLNVFLANLKKEKEILQINADPCPTCNISIEEILTTGKIGCSECFVHFQDYLLPIIMRVQDNANKHIGKEPRNISLEKQMALAIKEERYEDAAVLRDEIKNRPLL